VLHSQRLFDLRSVKGFGRSIRSRIYILIKDRQPRGFGRMPIHEAKIVFP